MTPHQNNRQPVPVTDTAAICLQIDALTVLRGQRLVIDQLTHQQKHGELCILTGANGAGKSTLLRSIAGRLPAESGHIACHLPRIYIGHADGLAGAISGRKNLQSWAAVNDITVQGAILNRHWPLLMRPGLPICRCNYCHAASAAGWPLRAFCWHHPPAYGYLTNHILVWTGIVRYDLKQL